MFFVLPDQHRMKKAMEYLTLFKSAPSNQPILKDRLDDTFISRFPNIAEAIFKELDNRSLGNCRISSKIWGNFIDEQKFPWVRRIGMHQDNLIGFSEDWRKVLAKAPYEPIKSLASAVEKFFSSRNKKTWFQFFGLKKYSKKQHQWAPHHIAAEYGVLELCEYIFQKTTLRNPATKFGTTPLHIVAAKGQTDLFQLIIKDSVEKNPGDKKRKTPLHLAAKEGHLEICKLIIDNVSEINPRDFRGKTPLHYAARSGHPEVYKFIMDRSIMADKNPGDNFGRTPLHIVVPRCSKDFPTREWDPKGISHHNERRFFELFKIILENVEEKNPGDINGWTPLHEATERELPEICKLISDNIMDENPITVNGLTPRKVGEERAYDLCCKFLFFLSVISAEISVFCYLLTLHWQSVGVYYLEEILTIIVTFVFPWIIYIADSRIYHSDVKRKLEFWLYRIYSIAILLLLLLLFMSNALPNFKYSSAMIGTMLITNALANNAKDHNISDL